MFCIPQGGSIFEAQSQEVSLIDNFGQCCHSRQPRFRFFGFFAALFLPSLLSLNGCGDSSVQQPEYSRLRAQVTVDAFEALANEPPAVAIPRLQRLEALLPNHDFPPLALEHERLRAVIRGVNDSIANGRFEKARSIAREASKRGRNAEVLDSVLDRVDALTAWDRYIEKKPFERSEQAREALDRLKDRGENLLNQPGFSAWLNEEKERIEAMALRERREQVALMATYLEIAAVRERPSAGLMAAQIADLVVTNIDMPMNEHEWLSRLAGWTREGSWVYSGYDCGTMLERRLMNAQNGCRSVAGQLMRARLAARNGNRSSALDILTRLWSKGDVPIGDGVRRELLQTLVLRSNQYRASPWRSAFPSVPDVLNRLAHIRAAWSAETRESRVSIP